MGRCPRLMRSYQAPSAILPKSPGWRIRQVLSPGSSHFICGDYTFICGVSDGRHNYRKLNKSMELRGAKGRLPPQNRPSASASSAGVVAIRLP